MNSNTTKHEKSENFIRSVNPFKIFTDFGLRTRKEYTASQYHLIYNNFKLNNATSVQSAVYPLSPRHCWLSNGQMAFQTETVLRVCVHCSCAWHTAKDRNHNIEKV